MLTSTDALLRLAPTLRANVGLTTCDQAQVAGVSAKRLSALAAVGLLVRRSRGVYASAMHADSWEHRALAAQLRAGPTAALSHGAAGRILGLEHLGVGRFPPIELTTPRGRRSRDPSSVVRHESIHFDPDRDRVSVGPFHVTSPAWTAAAMCARLDLGRAERLIDAVVASGGASIGDLRSMAERWAFTPGVVVLRAALLRHVEEGVLTRSEAERLFLRILRDAGLPLPQANVRVVDASGRVRYLDFAYVDLRISIEIDVHPSHGTSLGRSLDGARQNDLVLDWLPLRFDRMDLRHRPSEVAATVRRALVAVGGLAG